MSGEVENGARAIQREFQRYNSDLEAHAQAERYFRLPAQLQKIAKPTKEGGLQLVAKPQRTRDFDWHRPHLFVPDVQWQPTTGMTRYEFARRTTPTHQLEVFMRWQYRCQVNPPVLPPQEIWDEAAKAREEGVSLPNGLPGSIQHGESMAQKLRPYMLIEFSPDGQWRFCMQCVRMGEGLADRIDVRHRDYRTLADWTLLMRVRSWGLPDFRSAFLVMPAQDGREEGWEHKYENDTPNNLQLVSPRELP